MEDIIGNFVIFGIIVLFLYRDSEKAAESSFSKRLRNEQAKKENLRKKIIPYIIGIHIVLSTITYAFIGGFNSAFFLGAVVTVILCGLNFLALVILFKIIDVFIKGLGYNNSSLSAHILIPLNDWDSLYVGTLIMVLNCILTYKIWGEFILSKI
jgi:hypothetical protein